MGFEHIAVEACGASSTGRQRDRNEDQFLVGHVVRGLRITGSSLEGELAVRPPSGVEEGTLLLVADGIGGLPGGNIASGVAVLEVASELLRVIPWSEEDPKPREPAASLPGFRAGLEQAVVHGDHAVHEAGRNCGVPQMGTTLTVACVRFPRLYVAHVGDSRCYLLRDGELVRMTRDHTMAEELRGKPGQDVEGSERWNHVLWNALGGGDLVAAAEPEVSRSSLTVKDVVLLCSDGLTARLDDSTIAAALRRAESAAQACASLVALATARGANDDVTVVVARFREQSPATLGDGAGRAA